MRFSSERRWALVFGLLVACFTLIPYGFAYSQEGEAWRFSGYLFGVEDGNSYTAKMLLGAQGNWLFRTPYTPYPQGGVLAFLPYMLLGKLTAPPAQHEQLIGWFQFFRVIGVIVYALAAYDFLALFVRGVGLRRLGAALAVLGGGLGWLAVMGLGGLWKTSPLGAVLPGMDLPLEFYSPESFGFLMALGLPHLAVGRALLLRGLRDYLLPIPEAGGWLRRNRAGLLWLVMGLMQPLTVVSGWAVLAAHLLFTLAAAAFRPRQGARDFSAFWHFFWRAVRIGLLSAPIVVYTFLAFRLDPFLRGWESQNRIVSPPIHHYLLAFGPLLILAWWGARVLWHDGLAARGEPAGLARAAAWLPLAWALAFLPLAYAPYNLQRRLPDGIWVGLLAIALAGIERGLRPAGQRVAVRVLAGIGFLSTLLIFAGMTINVLRPAAPIFRPAAEVRAFETLAQEAPPDALVLAAYETSNALPAWAPVRVLVGLGPESINLTELNRRIACFYSVACADSDRLALLDEFGVAYVLHGPVERALGNWDPAALPGLALVYDQEGYRIFRYQGVAR